MHFQTSFSKMMNFLSEFLLNFGFNFQNFGSFSEPPTTNFFLKLVKIQKQKDLKPNKNHSFNIIISVKVQKPDTNFTHTIFPKKSRIFDEEINSFLF